MSATMKTNGTEEKEAEFDQTQNLKRQQKIDQLDKIHKDIDKIVDALNRPVDAGIKPTVAILNALGLTTTQSCEGHIEGNICGPWVDIGPKIPTDPEWYQDKKTLNKLKHDYLLMRIKLHELLQLFYKERRVDYDTILQHAELGYHVRLQSNASELIATLLSEEQEQALSRYRTEMEAFTAFLTERYLQP